MNTTQSKQLLANLVLAKRMLEQTETVVKKEMPKATTAEERTHLKQLRHSTTVVRNMWIQRAVLSCGMDKTEVAQVFGLGYERVRQITKLPLVELMAA